jgi:hypothetical protein
MVAVGAEQQARSVSRLDAVARRAPIDAVEAAANALDAVVAHRERADFTTWVLRTLVEHEVAGLEDLVAVLERPEILADLKRRDPLTPARLRGLRARKQLLEAEGGVVSGRELAAALGVTRQAVDKRRLAGKLIGIDLGKRGYVYPVWQVDLEGLDAVLAELADLAPWSQALFMLGTNSWLNGETPLARLRRGEIAEVVAAARLYGEQTAA